MSRARAFKMGASGAKRAVLGLFCLFLGLTAPEAEETPQVIAAGPWDGVATYPAPNTLAPELVQRASNILFDEGRKANSREGFAVFLTLGTSAPVRGAWAYTAPDGTEWGVFLSSHQLYGYNGSTTSLLLSGLDPDNEMDCAAGLGNLYCTDRSTDVFYFNGSSISYIASAPKASFIEVWLNRLVMADVSGAQSQLYLSGELGPTDWVVGEKSTSPVTWPIGGVNDGGNRITGLKCGVFDFCQIFTGADMWGFFGRDQRNFEAKKLYDDAGCVGNRTIKQHQGVLTWLSRNGVERYDRNVLQFPRISEDIRDQIEDVIALGGQELNWIQTTQADFAAGTHAETSDSLSPGSVVLATWTATDTSAADFTAGSFVNTTLNVSLARVELDTTDSDVDNNSFETAGAVGWSYGTWRRKSAGTFCPALTAQDGTYFAEAAAGGCVDNSVQLLDVNGNVLRSYSYGSCGGSSWTERDLPWDMSVYKGRWVKLQFRAGLNSADWMTSDPFLASGDTIRFSDIRCASGPFYWNIDLVNGGRSTIYSGTFTNTIDTALSTPAWLASGANWTTNGHGVGFETQSSSNNINYSALTAWTTGAAPASPWRRFLKYTLTLSTGGTTNGVGIPSVADVTFAARNSTGAFTSQVKDRGAVTQNGNFEANYSLDGGSMTFWVRTATSAAMVLSQAWTQQTPFTTLAASTDPFFQEQTRFQITLATQNPAQHDFTDFWNSGGNRPPLFAEVYRDRYHLFYSTWADVGAYNAKVAPLQRNLRWTFFDGITGASSCLYRNKFLVGDSQATGRILQLYSGYDDAGSAIAWELALRDHDGGDEDAEKVFDSLYVTADHETEEAQDIDVAVAYTVDGATATYSLGAVNLGETAGRIVAQVPFTRDGGNLNFGRWISPELSGSGVGEPVSIYGLRIYWKGLEVPR